MAEQVRGFMVGPGQGRAPWLLAALAIVVAAVVLVVRW